MGNLMAESSMIANIAQRGMTSLSNEEYTRLADDGKSTRAINGVAKYFYNDQIGYGLAQWTFFSRKRALSEFANSRGVSVGNEDMQVNFLIHEMRTDFPALFSYLCETDDLYTATERVCKEYERPAVNNVDRRHEFATVFANDLAPTAVESTKPESSVGWYPPDLSILLLQSVLVGNGYPVEITGVKDAKFLAVMREFLKDMGG
jgi:hypothetical protein